MWIEDYRKAHGMTVGDLAEKVLKLSRKRPGGREAHVGPIIARLEGVEGFVTVPGLADLIAEACEATPEQRDTLVLEKYRRNREKKTARSSYNRKPVAVIDKAGNVVETFPSGTAAGLTYGVSVDYVCKRARGLGGDSEFGMLDVTFRYTDEGGGVIAGD